MELDELTTRDVIECLVLEVVDRKGCSKSMAKKLVLNSLTYNLVTNEIYNQVDYLMGD